MKVYELLKELQFFPGADISDKDIIKAKKAGTTVPLHLSLGWEDGDYDEDLKLLSQKLKRRVDGKE